MLKALRLRDLEKMAIKVQYEVETLTHKMK